MPSTKLEFSVVRSEMSVAIKGFNFLCFITSERVFLYKLSVLKNSSQKDREMEKQEELLIFVLVQRHIRRKTVRVSRDAGC